MYAGRAIVPGINMSRLYSSGVSTTMIVASFITVTCIYICIEHVICLFVFLCIVGPTQGGFQQENISLHFLVQVTQAARLNVSAPDRGGVSDQGLVGPLRG